MAEKEKKEQVDYSSQKVLILEAASSDMTSQNRAAKAGERFLHAAAALPEGQYLGWQIAADVEGGILTTVFASGGVPVTAADYDWIFRDCARTGEKAELQEKDLFRERRVYQLISREGSSKDISELEGAACRSYGYDYDDDFRGTAGEAFPDLLDMLLEEGAVVRIIAGSGEESREKGKDGEQGTGSEKKKKPGEAPGLGSIRICLPEEMSLRLRAAFSMAIPHTAVTEVPEKEEAEKKDNLPDRLFLTGMTSFLYTLNCREGKKKADEAAGTPSRSLPVADEDELWSEDVDPDFHPVDIEDLDLSIRAYNCLKRAGIHTVEQLRSLSLEELQNIRNLGKKSVEDICRKLVKIPVQEDAGMEEGEAEEKNAGPVRALEKLEELVGLSEAKEQVKKIAAFARMKKARKEAGKGELPLALNMEFVGNPGTAKTTTARILAEIFHEIGLLPSGDLIEAGRADLVGRYVGQTAIKVSELFERARGKVLFIDEAYSLIDCCDNSYGDEAISTIVQEMENRREETVVIFAGYPEKMEEFFSRNPGLRSRVPFRVVFPDYSAGEMRQIVEKEAEKRGFSLDPEAEEKVLALCGRASGKAEAGNGRFCRNLVESAMLNYASRLYRNPEEQVAPDFRMAAEDFREPVSFREEKKQRVAGFRINGNEEGDCLFPQIALQ